MKKNIILVFIVSLLLVFASCTRKDVKDPDMNPGAGQNYNLSGTASPSTLYVPESNPAVHSDVSVRITDYKGNPLANGTVIFTHGGYGYFDSLQVSTQKTTNSSGIATVRYYLPAGTAIANEAMMNITAVLVNDGRLDSNLSPIQDIIPMRIIPYAGTSTLTLSGHVKDSNGQALEGAIIQLSNNGGVALTRSSGSYEISVARGWSGEISGSYNGAALVPAKYNFTNLTQSVSDLDFVAQAAAVTLVLSQSAITIPQDGSGPIDGVDGFVYYEVFAREASGNVGTWYTVKSDSSWLIVTGGALNDTPHHFHFKTNGANTTGIDRVGNIIVTPLSSKYGKPSGNPATLIVTQSATAAIYALTTPTPAITMNESSSIEVTIGDTNAAADYTIASATPANTTDFSTAIVTASTASGNGRIRITCGAIGANTTTTVIVSATGATPVIITVTANNI